MLQQPELLAPAGSLETLKYAVMYGADAVYCALPEFGMRAAPVNLTVGELHEGCIFAHARGKKVYLTLNTLPTNEELSKLPRYIQDAAEAGVEVALFQSNHEGAIVDAIQAAYGTADGIVINPAAYTHTSIAILDALKAVALPAVEVHLSDVSAREDFRQISYAGMACVKTYMGLGFEGYRQAILYLKQYLEALKTSITLPSATRASTRRTACTRLSSGCCAPCRPRSCTPTRPHRAWRPCAKKSRPI